MTRAFKIWLVSLLLTAVIVLISIQWLDRSIALEVRAIFGQRNLPIELTESPLTSTSLAAALAFAVFGILATMGRTFSKFEVTIAICVISTLAAIIMKDQLKVVFGRTWPDTWAPGIVSFLGNGVYGFHFFHPGRSFESFPSGHATVAAAVFSVPWILFPRLRVLLFLGVFAVDAGLVALNLHFLSDTIAGTFVGFSTGLFTIGLCRAIGSDVTHGPTTGPT
jgi:membrane-associated phospholipid phosphatase